MNEMVTDAFRALLLDYAGYSNVKVFEFIGGEHTSKNVMITAVKTSKKQTEKRRELLRHQIREFCASHGIRKQRLADWMGLDLMTASTNSDTAANQQRRLSKGTMPPLLGP